MCNETEAIGRYPIHSIHVEKRKYIERVSSRWQDISRWNNEAQPVGVKSRTRWWQEGYPDSLSKVPAQYLSTGVGARTASQPAETRSVVVGPDESPREQRRLPRTTAVVPTGSNPLQHGASPINHRITGDTPRRNSPRLLNSPIEVKKS